MITLTKALLDAQRAVDELLDTCAHPTKKRREQMTKIQAQAGVADKRLAEAAMICSQLREMIGRQEGLRLEGLKHDELRLGDNPYESYE